jgi:uncharacterized protein (DUF4415 family)
VSTPDGAKAYGERRFPIFGLLEGQAVSAAHTERCEDIRIIQFEGPRNMKRASTSRRSSTKLSKVRKTIDADIVREADAPEWTPEMFARAVARRGLKPVPKKALLSLRIDSDVVEWFRKQGAGYQSRMNALLRAYMEAHKQAEL